MRVEYPRVRAGFEIIEIKGARLESIDIWDRNASLGKASKALLQRYLTLFRLIPVNQR